MFHVPWKAKPPETRSNSSGFTLVSLMVGVALISILSVMGSTLLVSLNRGMKGAQDRADYVQMQSLGTELLSADPHAFCEKAKIIGLKLPSAEEARAFISRPLDSHNAKVPDLFNPQCVSYPYPSQPVLQAQFILNPEGFLRAIDGNTISENRSPGSDPGSNQNSTPSQEACARVATINPSPGSSPAPNKHILLPFAFKANRETGGPISRDFMLNLSVDSAGAITDCMASSYTPPPVDPPGGATPPPRPLLVQRLAIHSPKEFNNALWASLLGFYGNTAQSRAFYDSCEITNTSLSKVGSKTYYGELSYCLIHVCNKKTRTYPLFAMSTGACGTLNTEAPCKGAFNFGLSCMF